MAAGETAVVSCKQCKSDANVNSKNLIKCSGVCDNYFHCACVNFKEYEMKLMSSKNCNLMWMCDDCKSRFMDNKGIMKIIGELKDIISKQSQQIEVLSKKIVCLSTNNNTLVDVNEDKKRPEVKERNSQKNVNKHLRTTSDSSMRAARTTHLVPDDKPDNEVRLTAMSADGAAESNNEGFTVVNKKKNKRNIIIGTASEPEEEIKAVPKTSRTWIHVSRFQLDFSEDQLKQYISKKTSITNIMCSKHKSRNENATYSSFKVGVERNWEDIFLNPETWPAGIAVSKYNFFRARRNETRQ